MIDVIIFLLNEDNSIITYFKLETFLPHSLMACSGRTLEITGMYYWISLDVGILHKTKSLSFNLSALQLNVSSVLKIITRDLESFNWNLKWD